MAPENAGERLDALTDLVTPMAVRTAVTLRVPDLIADGTTHLAALARRCGADRDALGRLLRHLVHREVFAEVSPDVFALTGLGELLRDRGDTGYGTRFDLDAFPARMDLAALGLPHAVRTGEPGYASVHGRDFWSDLDATPEYRAHFDRLMAGLQASTAPQVAKLYPWPEVGLVADVGGGSGALLAELLAAHGHLRGMLVDRAEPVATAAARFAGNGLGGRVEAVEGDFFQPLPAGADVYVVSRVLTDWNDASAATILRRCAEAAGPDGRVLVVEVLPTEPHVPHLSPFDLRMLVEVGGRERDRAAHDALAASVGLAPARTFAGSDGLALMEFRAALR